MTMKLLLFLMLICIGLFGSMCVRGDDSLQKITENAFVDKEPFVFVDSGKVIHLFWSSNASGDYDIFETINNGSGWGSFERITNLSSNETEPVAIQDNEGKMHLFFTSNYFNKSQIFEMLWENGTWQKPVALFDGKKPFLVNDLKNTIHLYFHNLTYATPNMPLDLPPFIICEANYTQNRWGESHSVYGILGSSAIVDDGGNIHIYGDVCGFNSDSIYELVFTNNTWNDYRVPTNSGWERLTSIIRDNCGGYYLFYENNKQLWMIQKTSVDNSWGADKNITPNFVNARNPSAIYWNNTIRLFFSSDDMGNYEIYEITIPVAGGNEEVNNKKTFTPSINVSIIILDTLVLAILVDLNKRRRQ